MAFNLLETVRGYVTPELTEKAGNYLGESSTGIGKAAQAAIPAVLAMFVNRAEKGDAQGLLQEAKETASSTIISNPQSYFSGGMGTFLSGTLDRLKGVFGGSSAGLISAVASYGGIKQDSAQGLLGLLAPLGLGVLGKHAQETNMTAQGMDSYLSSQKSTIMNALPTGFSLGSLLGDQSATLKKLSTGTGMSQIRSTVRKTAWMPWLLIGLVVIALAWILGRNLWNKKEPVGSAQPTVMSQMDTTRTTSVTPGRTTTKLTLVNGVVINAYKDGVEDHLIACLDNAACKAGKDKWFDFDNISFETGSSRLTSASLDQVQNIVAILKAYPKAKIKIGGYTDKVGDAASNKTLSQKRAEAVMNAIKSAGANPSQLTGAEGYGSEFAKVSASASDEERRKDRRISVQLNEK